VLLVHGSARAPAVQRLVRQLCGKEPLRLARPEESVAIGAAAHAEALQAAQYQTA
jgi:molecular chaperone DnaK